MAFAMTAPAAPATAAPHGGNGGNAALLAIGRCFSAGQEHDAKFGDVVKYINIQMLGDVARLNGRKSQDER